jgi:hypothetical protein
MKEKGSPIAFCAMTMAISTMAGLAYLGWPYAFGAVVWPITRTISRAMDLFNRPPCLNLAEFDRLTANEPIAEENFRRVEFVEDNVNVERYLLVEMENGRGEYRVNLPVSRWDSLAAKLANWRIIESTTIVCNG